MFHLNFLTTTSHFALHNIGKDEFFFVKTALLYHFEFILFFQSQCNDIAAIKWSEDSWGALKGRILIFLNLALSIQSSGKAFRRKTMFTLYWRCMAADSHLGIDKIQSFFDLFFAGVVKSKFLVLVIPCYIALKNNLSFGNFTIPENIEWSLSLKRLTGYYKKFIFDNSSIDNGKAHEMFTDLIMWVASVERN